MPSPFTLVSVLSLLVIACQTASAQSTGSSSIAEYDLELIPLARNTKPIEYTFPRICEGASSPIASYQMIAFLTGYFTKLKAMHGFYRCIQICDHRFLIAELSSSGGGSPFVEPGISVTEPLNWKEDKFFWVPDTSMLEAHERATVKEKYLIDDDLNISPYTMVTLVQLLMNCAPARNGEFNLIYLQDSLATIDLAEDAVVLRSIMGYDKRYAKYCHPIIERSNNTLVAIFFAHSEWELVRYLIKLDIKTGEVLKVSRKHITRWYEKAT